MVKISWLVFPKKICIYSNFLKNSKYSQKHKGSTFRCVGTGEATVSPKFRDILKGNFFRKIGLIYREKILELHLEKLVPPPLSTFTLRKNNITIHYKWWASSHSGPKMKHFFFAIDHYASMDFMKNQTYYTCNVCNIYNNYSFCIVIIVNAFFNVCNSYIMMVLFYDLNCLLILIRKYVPNMQHTIITQQKAG